jgi:hypothetical protein
MVKKRNQVYLKLDDEAVADLTWVEDRLKCSRGAAVAAAAKALHLILAAGYNALLDHPAYSQPIGRTAPVLDADPKPSFADLQARIRQIETRTGTPAEFREQPEYPTLTSVILPDVPMPAAGGEQPRGPDPEAPGEPGMTRVRLQGMTKARKDYWVRSQGWGLNPDDEGDHAEIDAHIAELPYK